MGNLRLARGVHQMTSYDADDKSTYVRSSWCDSDACVEVARLSDGNVVLRSTALHSNPVSLTEDEWRAFLSGIKSGDFDAL